MVKSRKILFNPLFLIESSQKLNEKTKKRITSRLILVENAISQIEATTGMSYPEFYIEPVLTLSVSPDDCDEIGILYARTVPLELQGMVRIVVQLSAAFVLCATKSTLRLVLAHEFLHYVELVKEFNMGGVLSETSPEYLYEESYHDSERAFDPQIVFAKEQKLAKDLAKKFQRGIADERLNEKCRTSWIEKGMPTAKIFLAENQTRIPMEALANTTFDPDVVQFLSNLDSNHTENVIR